MSLNIIMIVHMTWPLDHLTTTVDSHTLAPGVFSFEFLMLYIAKMQIDVITA